MKQLRYINNKYLINELLEIEQNETNNKLNHQLLKTADANNEPSKHIIWRLLKEFEKRLFLQETML